MPAPSFTFGHILDFPGQLFNFFCFFHNLQGKNVFIRFINFLLQRFGQRIEIFSVSFHFFKIRFQDGLLLFRFQRIHGFCIYRRVLLVQVDRRRAFLKLRYCSEDKSGKS